MRVEPDGARAAAPSVAPDLAAALVVAPDAAPAAAPAPPARPRFRYEGPTSLRVVGPRTGQLYRFDVHGHELDVDPRDAPFLAAVPRLVRVGPGPGGRP